MNGAGDLSFPTIDKTMKCQVTNGAGARSSFHQWEKSTRSSLPPMALVPDDFTTWSWSKRRLIVVWDDDVVRRAESQELDDGELQDAGKAEKSVAPPAAGLLGQPIGVYPGGGTPATVLGTAAGAATGAFLGTAAVAAVTSAAKYVRESKQKAERAGLRILDVSESQAVGLHFPHGHPRRKVVYVGDPEVPNNYYPLGSFHREMFDSKVSEVTRLLMGLGATSISVEYTEGYKSGGSIKFAASTPKDTDVELGGGIKRTSEINSNAKITMNLSPTKRPEIPEGLVWFRHERQWQEIATARLEHGLQNFSLEVRYTDDLGIDANLVAKIHGVGFESGGTVTNFKETVWSVSGTFGTDFASRI